MKKLDRMKYIFILLLVIGITAAAAFVEHVLHGWNSPSTIQSENLIRTMVTANAARTLASASAPALTSTSTSASTTKSASVLVPVLTLTPAPTLAANSVSTSVPALTATLPENIVATAVAQTLGAYRYPATKTSDFASIAITATMSAFSRMLIQTMSAAQASPTPLIPPTAAVPPTAAIPPTAVILPTAIVPTAKPCELFSFVTDVTIPDGTVMTPGQAFTKTWRLRNEGSCTWPQSYSFAYMRGDIMGAPTLVYLPHPVAPGQTVDISVPMIAPTTNGSYRGNWILRNASYIPFGSVIGVRDGVWVDIRVQDGWSPSTPNPGGSGAFACQYLETKYSDEVTMDVIYKVVIRNTGTATWSKTDVDLEFYAANGPDADFFIGNLGERKDLPRNVAPGEVVEIGEWISFVAPDYFASHKFQTVWRLVNNSEVICIFNGLGNINPNPY